MGHDLHLNFQSASERTLNTEKKNPSKELSSTDQSAQLLVLYLLSQTANLSHACDRNSADIHASRQNNVTKSQNSKDPFQAFFPSTSTASSSPRMDSPVAESPFSLSAEQADLARVAERLLHEKTQELRAEGSFQRASIMQDDDKKITLVVGRLLGEGAFGAVYEALDVTQPQEEAVKFAHHPTDTSLEKEYHRLHRVNPDRRPGLQLPPRIFVHLTSSTSLQLPGYLAPLYQSNMQEVHLQTSSNIREAFSQLTGGVLQLHHLQIYHGDIKQENMLTMPGRYDIADLGSVQETSDIQKNLDLLFDSEPTSASVEKALRDIWGLSTMTYVYPRDYDALRSILTFYSQEVLAHPDQRSRLMQEAVKDVFLAMQARDAYALSLSLKELTLSPRTSVGVPKENYVFFQTEPPTKAEEMHKNLMNMGTRMDSLELAAIRNVYTSRLQGLQRLHDLVA